VGGGSTGKGQAGAKTGDEGENQHPNRQTPEGDWSGGATKRKQQVRRWNEMGFLQKKTSLMRDNGRAGQVNQCANESAADPLDRKKKKQQKNHRDCGVAYGKHLGQKKVFIATKRGEKGGGGGLKTCEGGQHKL